MKYLFKNLKPYWLSVIFLALLLIIQAFGEISMPEYTQDIIDVGIQNRGVSHILPSRITEEEFEEAQIFMDDGQKTEWKGAYKKSEDMYILQITDEKNLDYLDDSLLTPIVMTYQLGHMSEDAFRSMMSGIVSKQFNAMSEKVPTASASAIKAQGKEALKGIKTMSVKKLAKLYKLDINTFKAEDENGKSSTYVDVRPAMQKLIESGQMDSDQTDQMKKQINDTIDTVGTRTLKAMGIRYAYEAAGNAGVDVNAQQKAYLWACGGRILVMALLMMAAATAVSFIAARVGAGIGRDLRVNVFKNVIGYSNSEMDKFETSSLITRATNDVQQVQMVTTMMLRMVLYAPVLGIWGIIKVYNTHANMSWVILLGIAVIMSMIMALVSLAMPKFKMMQKLVDKVNGVSREILTGLMVIRAFGRQEKEEERFDKANTDLMRTQLFTNRIMSFMMPGMMLIMNALAILITWVASHRVDSGALQVGAMTAFITYSMMIISAFMILTMMSVMLPRAGVAAERIEEVVSTHSSIEDTENPVTINERKGLIEFDHVNFRYPGAESDVLSDISFTAEPGRTIAIIGSTGSGKSTVINLIPRFYDVTGGTVRLDGTDIRKLSLKDLRESIGFVPQKGILFSGTIASNIKFGVPDTSDDVMKKAAMIAQADEFIDGKDDKYETYISQGGNNVSGGQKQRLSIARALAKKPEVLVFDDSFSALDMKTDAKLREVLAKEEKDVTNIIVAQRISTVINADQIIVLDEGRIVGKGTHRELMNICEVYRQIASSQLSQKELEVMQNG